MPRAILDLLPGLAPGQFLGEPIGRDTLGAVGLARRFSLKPIPKP